MFHNEPTVECIIQRDLVKTKYNQNYSYTTIRIEIRNLHILQFPHHFFFSEIGPSETSVLQPQWCDHGTHCNMEYRKSGGYHQYHKHSIVHFALSEHHKGSNTLVGVQK